MHLDTSYSFLLMLSSRFSETPVHLQADSNLGPILQALTHMCNFNHMFTPTEV